MLLNRTAKNFDACKTIRFPECDIFVNLNNIAEDTEDEFSELETNFNGGIAKKSLDYWKIDTTIFTKLEDVVLKPVMKCLTIQF